MLFIGSNFGTTTAILAQDTMDLTTEECGHFDHIETNQSTRRAQIFAHFVSFMGLESENYYGCADKFIAADGAGNVPSNWDKSTNENQCELVSFVTQFSVYNAEDYKKCVCYFYSKNGHEVDCP